MRGRKVSIRCDKIIFIVVLTVLELSFFGNSFELWGLQHLVPDRVIEQDTDTVEFLLYPKPESVKYREELIADDPVSIQTSLYNKSRPLIILIHGFVSESKSKSGFVEIVKNAYLNERTEANIVAVDWSKLSTPKTFASEAFYELAALNVKPVGRKVADFLLFMIKNDFVSGPENVHIVGFSLGAHVSGKAGRYYFKSTGSLLGRITGLDPAGPVFSIKIGTAGIIDLSDAEFVDILHTNIGQNGYLGALGHVDFYANGGGPKQPNCSILSITTGGCSHSAAYRYFAKSIRDPTIKACKCDQYIKTQSCMDSCGDPVIFGESCPTTARGVYYLPITYDTVDT